MAALDARVTALEITSATHEIRIAALEVTIADHESRIAALETDQVIVRNVYDRTPSQGASGGTKNTQPVRRTGGVYPRRHG